MPDQVDGDCHSVRSVGLDVLGAVEDSRYEQWISG